MATLDNQPGNPAAPPGARREQFIALRKADLAETLAGHASLPASEAQHLRRFCRMLHVLVHAEFQAPLEELKNAYAPFDPDADTRSQGDDLPADELARLRGRLFDKFGWLLARGNFHRLAEEEINQALKDRSHWGLHLKVDFELFDRLELYYRGDVIGTRYRRRLQNRFRPEEVLVPMYQRLVIIFRLRPSERLSRLLDTQAVYIKLFKEIPKLDLDMLLPESKVRMTLFDQLRVSLPTATGIGIALFKMLAAPFTLGLSLAFLMFVGGTLGYGVRSLYGYLNTRQKYQLNLTQSLYYQNIDNNAGVIHRLLDEAEEQENREVMLAYYFLWREAPPDGWMPEALDARIEAFLHEHAELAVDFEIGDALDKLERFGLAETCDGRWRAKPIEQAIAALAKRWAAMPETLEARGGAGLS